jgi:hypothetical protein
MSLNKLTSPDFNSALDIICKSCDCQQAKIAESLEVRDFFFDAVNGDKIELSTLENKGAVGAVLKSDGNNGVLWGSDISGGVIYNGTLPTENGGLTLYSGIDGSTIKNSVLTETDLLNTESKANSNESDITNIETDITDLQNDKVAKAGDTMTGNLTLSGTNELQTRFIQDNGGGLYGIEAKSLFKTPFGLRTTSIRHTTPGSSVRLDDNIDCNNKQLRNCNSIQTSTLSTQAGLGGQITVVGGPINLNANNITNVGNISTNNLSVVSGGSITLQDDFNINNFDLLNINTATVSNIEGCLSINGLTPVGGLYCGISDGVVINQASGQTNLLPVSSVGSLAVPANGFSVGDAFHLVVAGIFPTESKNDDITIDVKQNGTTIASINLDLENFDTESSNFELEMDFVIRSIGVAGVVASNLDFSFNKSISKDFKGTRITTITTINTTTASSLSVLATVNGASGSSIQSRMAYLRKQY